MKSQTTWIGALQDTWRKIPDDIKHYYGTAIVYQACNIPIIVKTKKIGRAIPISVGVSFAVSVIGKEIIWDDMMGRGVKSTNDIAVDILSIGGNTCVSIPLDAHYVSKWEERKELEQIMRSKRFEMN